MFTGIIECLGIIKKINKSDDNVHFWLESNLAPDLKVDQSLAHDGVCLTVEEVSGRLHRVTAIRETLAKTNLGTWDSGKTVNLERALSMGGRLDGHMVQGHVDATATCISKLPANGSWEYAFSFPDHFAPLVIEKGSICVNGISLTAFGVTLNSFNVAIIPYTYDHTNIGLVESGQSVNLEFDMIGKYIQRWQSLSTDH